MAMASAPAGGANSLALSIGTSSFVYSASDLNTRPTPDPASPPSYFDDGYTDPLIVSSLASYSPTLTTTEWARVGYAPTSTDGANNVPNDMLDRPGGVSSSSTDGADGEVWSGFGALDTQILYSPTTGGTWMDAMPSGAFGIGAYLQQQQLNAGSAGGGNYNSFTVTLVIQSTSYGPGDVNDPYEVLFRQRR